MKLNNLPTSDRLPLLDILGWDSNRLSEELRAVGEDTTGTKPEKQSRVLTRYYPELNECNRVLGQQQMGNLAASVAELCTNLRQLAVSMPVLHSCKIRKKIAAN